MRLKIQYTDEEWIIKKTIKSITIALNELSQLECVMLGLPKITIC